MAIIVEDGSQVTNANSLVSEADFETYAEGIGTALTGEPETLLRNAMQYIDSLESRLKGSRVARGQALSFPRSDVVIDGFEWDDDEIPRNAILAQMALAVEIDQGSDPYNPTRDMPVVKERIEGAVEVQYANPVGAFKLSKTSRAQALLNSLMRSGGMAIALERA